MPRLTRTAGRVALTVGLAAATVAAALAPATAQAGPLVPTPSTTPANTPSTTVPVTTTVPAPPTIALVLAPYVGTFDTNNNNFNIATQVLLQFPDLAFATTKPGTNTVFLPTDYAFRALVKALTGKVVVPERQVFQAIQRLGRTKVGAIVRTHVLRNVRLGYGQALLSNGKVFTTWQGGTIRVQVTTVGRRAVVLQDGATTFADPKIINANIRASNGIIHVIDRVLLPANP